MKTSKFFVLVVLIIWGSTADAQRIKGGAGFVKVGIANAPGAGSILNQIAPAGVSGFSDQFYVLGGEGYYRTGPIVLALSCWPWTATSVLKMPGHRVTTTEKGTLILATPKSVGLSIRARDIGFIPPLVLVPQLWR